ncbi:FKBP-type 22 kDa peptidyl-prolyl cis-trans isomerase [BD1-7 clade bacterium]|uniref:Peptidyl-prolyl cis-trans isomerase n=1 Tax=BD1-7 clade bacterium TaxID=2029982 RepID=A0A5S9QFU5_9GAMM|nr:FKBP-type 22 kDa peptidyl-prolyl cis-trans isomerase [BD1-7 clade bacterium]CAA0117451.1 FKBP-type 22 kDa peptidyl-prolyl cis-trans isomerase [BD1-7 clade bacterium]
MPENTITLETDEQKVSYGFGLQFGQQLLRNKFDGLEAATVAQGIADILEENAVQISESDLNEAYANIQRVLQEKAETDAKKMSELGQSFLEENAKREGVQLTESGIQYEILEEGDGEKPTTDNTVKVHYHGTFMDGQVFDSSVERGEPATFGVTQVIAGWTEALQMMPTGSKWRLVLPPELAYGDAGAPPSIPGGAVLVFEVHLIDIV